METAKSLPEDAMHESGQSASTLRRLPIYALFLANTISYVGSVLTQMAIPWFVLQTTGSYVQMGITAFMSALPGIISSFFSSFFIDRLGYKRVSIIGDVASGLSVLLIPLCYHTMGLPFWALLILVFLSGLFSGPGRVVRMSMLPELAAMARMPLEHANAVFDGISRISGFLGAPLAGVLIIVIGTSNLLWLDAVSFFISALLISLTLPDFAPVKKQEEKQSSYLNDLAETFSFISKQKVIVPLICVVMITNLLDAAGSAVIIPAYVEQILDSPVYLGLLWGSLGGAAFLGTVIFGAIGHRLPRRLTFGLCYNVLGLRFWVMAFYLSPAFLIEASALSGLAAGPLNPLMATVFQRLVPAEKRASIFGVMSAGTMAGMPLGGLLGGLMLNWMGLTLTLFLVAICYLLATGSLLVNPVLKRLDRME